MIDYARRQQNIQQNRQKHTIKHKEEHNIQKDKKLHETELQNTIHSITHSFIKHQIPTELHLEKKE